MRRFLRVTGLPKMRTSPPSSQGFGEAFVSELPGFAVGEDHGRSGWARGVDVRDRQAQDGAGVEVELARDPARSG